jgi:hypothetical protein
MLYQVSPVLSVETTEVVAAWVNSLNEVRILLRRDKPGEMYARFDDKDSAIKALSDLQEAVNAVPYRPTNPFPLCYGA